MCGQYAVCYPHEEECTDSLIQPGVDLEGTSKENSSVTTSQPKKLVTIKDLLNETVDNCDSEGVFCIIDHS